MTTNLANEIDPDALVDQLYDIALDPQSLDRFIDAWNNAGLDASEARKTIDQFDEIYSRHLLRAETFLQRGSEGDDLPDLAATLTPFNNLAAFIIDKGQTVVASNAGASQAFGVRDGLHLDALQLEAETHDALAAALNGIFQSDDRPDCLLKVDFKGQRGPAVFQIRRLAEASGDRGAVALVVTTQYHWQATLGQTLEEVFGLTGAEQGVVRALVEGMDAKTIAAERGTSEGTVRGQIKSILAKMNARTQSEVIRLVMSLRDVSKSAEPNAAAAPVSPEVSNHDFWQVETWKPFKMVTLPDGRRLEYHDMGPVTGAPIFYTHMGYGMARWHAPMLKLAYRHGLRIICMIRAGYGHSSNIDPKADVLASTRQDTLNLLAHLGIKRLPYVSQGNDLIFAVDFAAHHSDMISEVVGLSARPSLPGDLHYSGMGKWHRFFLSTAKHAPHLLKFTSKAAVAMARRIGLIEMFRQMNNQSAADMEMLNDPALAQVLAANAELVAGKSTDVSQAYTMEIIASEAPWSDLMHAAKKTKTWFVNGGQDPAMDVATIAQYREHYPWIDIEVLNDAGQMMIYQKYPEVIPKLAAAAKRA